MSGITHASPATEAPARIAAASHVTLHYRLAIRDGMVEREVISTLDGRPATLQVGSGSLPPALEERLLGLAEGQRAHFELGAGVAFGERSPALVQKLARAVFDTNADPSASFAVGDVVEFNAPDGGRYSGVLKALDERSVLVDFNHPLAGHPVSFDVHVIGVL